MITIRSSTFALSFIFVCTYTLPGSYLGDEQPALAKRKSQYPDAMVKGVGIGMLTGGWCALTDVATGGVYAPLTWPASFVARKVLVLPALDSYDVDEAHRYRDTINTAAWVSSWASYITAWCLFGSYKLSTPRHTLITHYR